jgi:hypothetical protein
MRNVHYIQEATKVEEVARNILKNYATLDNRRKDHQLNMIKVEGKISKQPIAILIDSVASHIYIAPNLVEISSKEK